MVTLVAEWEGALIAFAQLRRGGTPSCVTGPSPIELRWFYLTREWHGRGLAQQVMARVFETATALGAQTIWLGVWEHNPRAMAFYRKVGYVDVGSHVYMLGTDAQTDRIYTRRLEYPPPGSSQNLEAACES